MELPVIVRQALGDSAEHVELKDVSSTETGAQALRMVLLNDDQGRVQVICRNRDLIDINALNKQLNRDLRMMPGSDQLLVRERTGLRDLPALPSLTGLPTVVDVAVDDLAVIALNLIDQGVTIMLKGAEFKELSAGAQRMPIAVEPQSVGVNRNRPDRDLEQLTDAIKRFTGLRIKQRLDDTLELPPLPETAQRIIQLRVNPNSMVGDLVDIVESDPSLAAQVVSWASSSFYAAAGQIRSVYDAVCRVLGFDLVMNLAVGLSLGRAMAQPQDRPEGYVDYWQQAIWQAQAAGLLASLMPRGQRPAFGLAYLSGLLHNFGYLVLAHIFPPHFKLVCRSLEINPQVDSSLIEHFLLGITREQIGAQLMANWGMPDEVTVAVRHQKDPDYDGEYDVYPKLLWLGRQLLTERGIALGAGERVADSFYQELGLDKAKVAEHFDELVEAKDSVLAIAGMMQG
ncbi:aminoacyl-tRNA deacylase and HDOD domain-containing protein [Marinobacter sp. SS21]|uniref:aminoacyl-tRNA deacylase and HDOD domain-containing protein n=1 Tax=Marinobacter sp. SS21 TaxID=2979460 RepID=UPI00232B61BC|nr:HDOD domain-containing protein [Marinobacter sp. SS21]MDC0663988.1 HDOD domain-containing protein [Marinobacter sp. SS21]